MEVSVFYQKVKYPQHFNRLFKQRVGMFPNDYRGIK
jgi:AraC-like DNA-binding protein